MKIGQLNKQIRSVIIPGKQYLMNIKIDLGDRKQEMMVPVECIGAYAHVATFKEMNYPNLTYSHNWFDLHNMIVKGQLKQRKKKKK